MVHYTSYISYYRGIIIGKDVWKSFAKSGGCYIQGANGLIIGDYTIFAPGVKIVSGNHDPENLQNMLPSEPLEIGRHCWIGANAVILPGVKLGDRCIVGAGAVVTKSFPAGSIIGGIPAKIIASQPCPLTDSD